MLSEYERHFSCANLKQLEWDYNLQVNIKGATNLNKKKTESNQELCRCLSVLDDKAHVEAG